MIDRPGVALVRERYLDGPVPRWVHPAWETRFPWLVQGTTGSGTPGEPFDLGLSGRQPVNRVLARWHALRHAVGCPTVVCTRQSHGADLWAHGSAAPPGLLLMEGRDGHLTSQPGLALTVTVADCVPCFLVDARNRAIALLHAGWRGIAAGILESAVHAMTTQLGIRATSLWLHFGPAICGDCYEVGPEVRRALELEAAPADGGSRVDLRSVLAARAVRLELAAERITRSEYCTRCSAGPDGGARPFFSHRAGDEARQVGFLAIRAGQPLDPGGSPGP